MLLTLPSVACAQYPIASTAHGPATIHGCHDGDIQTCLEARGYRMIPADEVERIRAERAARQSSTPAQ